MGTDHAHATSPQHDLSTTSECRSRTAQSYPEHRLRSPWNQLKVSTLKDLAANSRIVLVQTAKLTLAHRQQ